MYTVNDESKHLLIFGVPSLNLRQELKALFIKFGKLTQFAITENYPKENFTDNFYAIYETIQSARIAKKMLDTKNFYGGVLHVCYAPELETLDDVREKLLQRKREVYRQLQKSRNDSLKTENEAQPEEVIVENTTKTKLNMGDINTIGKSVQNVYNTVIKRKTYMESDNHIKRHKNCYIEKEFEPKIDINIRNNEIELNYNNFGNEVIKKYNKPLNKIVFHVSNKNK